MNNDRMTQPDDQTDSGSKTGAPRSSGSQHRPPHLDSNRSASHRGTSGLIVQGSVGFGAAVDQSRQAALPTPASSRPGSTRAPRSWCGC
jgi:hypothetical protein